MRISGAESVVMEALWKRSPRSAEDVAAEVAGPQGWTEATVKTLINRLLKKKAVEAARDGRRYLYAPRVSREAWVAAESQGLVDRLFDGRVAPLVSHFSKTKKLSAQDVAELKALIAELGDDR
ncbi:BlaI/MecI/CopY family transcriptional regulator [Phenylobacterium sp. J367]|uniref:BlaI/MecI/CopY family transcriptional regulator n=1 Tax=Phenylobacterium sp. J367 TaxID=2898435 RepID=UPI0021509075|nr:BlaI/MecI/CopY family transcriptional regulator [Phenylobacterium sp. J367]MCR5880610.1 BlaI/MecI/CopY family transcriptional regulator [Phenylobacterium sp. J367]